MISVFGIALEALRPRIPACHDPVRVEHVDGVVGHALNEQAEALLAH